MTTLKRMLRDAAELVAYLEGQGEDASHAFEEYVALRDAVAAYENLSAVQARCTELLEELRTMKGRA